MNGIKKFAWVPTRLENSKWIWLRKYFSFYHTGKTGFGDLYLKHRKWCILPLTSNFDPIDAIMHKLKLKNEF